MIVRKVAYSCISIIALLLLCACGEKNNQLSNFETDGFIENVRYVTEQQLATEDKCDKVQLENNILYIELDIVREEQVLNKYMNITDKILEIRNNYDMWDTLIIKMGDFGTVTKEKMDFNDGYYEVTTEDLKR